MQNIFQKFSDTEDNEVIRQVVEGNVNAFEHLLTKYKNYVANLVAKHLPYNHVEETAHEVFVRAYQSLPTFKGISSFKQWLSSIAVRTCYDFWRVRYRSRELLVSSLSEKHREWLETVISDSSSCSYYDQGARKEARELLDWALERLSPEDRMVLELVYLEGLSVKEVAELLGWSAANVKVRSFRSRKKLRKLLSGLSDKEVIV
jgi:RNA polymerase sigma-70 factor (ECF subfamily)